MLILDQIQLFNKYSFKAYTDFKRYSISFKEQFGYNEDFYNYKYSVSIKPNKAILEDVIQIRTSLQERIYRLLVLDSFIGYHNLELYKYYIQFDIVIVFLPPHSLYKTQPIDIGIFQHLKDTYQQQLRNTIQARALSFSQANFVEGFYNVQKTSFQRKYIIAGFEKTSIFLSNYYIIINQLTNIAKKYTTPIFPSILLDNNYQQDIKLGIKQIKQKYQYLFSSPTYKYIYTIITTLYKGELARKYIAKFTYKYKEQLNKYSRKKNRRLAIKPSGEVITSISVKEIYKQQEIRY